jgi:hypothetical protein
MRRTSFTVAAIVAALGCAGNSTRAGGESCDISTDFTVTRPTRTGLPRFDWSPRYRLARLVVEPVDQPGNEYWRIDGAQPPLDYGERSSGATVVVAPRPLTPGDAYRVVWAWGEPDDPQIGGSRSFVY